MRTSEERQAALLPAFMDTIATVNQFITARLGDFNYRGEWYAGQYPNEGIDYGAKAEIVITEEGDFANAALTVVRLSKNGREYPQKTWLKNDNGVYTLEDMTRDGEFKPPFATYDSNSGLADFAPRSRERTQLRAIQTLRSLGAVLVDVQENSRV